MMNLEEIVKHVEQVAYSNNDEALVCMGIKEYRELAGLLRELQERRKAPEVVFCKDCRKHNAKVGFDENFHTVWKEDACPLVDWRGKAKEHEFDYQYCAFAERKTE